MIPYLIVFIFTPLCAYLSEKSFNNKQKYKGVLFAILTILIPSIIAGFRDISVGVDGKVYVEPVLRSFKGLTISRAWGLHKIEKGYIILTYIVSLITLNPNVMLFIINLIISYFIYMTAFKYRNHINMTIFIIIYVLYFYTKSLNIMRQCIGIVIFMYSLTFLKNKNYVKAFIFTFLAILFHNSILICCSIYLLFFINNLKIKKIYKTFITIFLLIGVAFLSFNIREIVKTLVLDWDFLPQKYYDYTNKITNFKFNYIDLIVKGFLAFLALMVCNNEKENEDDIFNRTMFESIIIGLILTISMATIGQSGEIHRLSFAFVYIGASYLNSKVLKLVKNNLFNKVIVYLIIIGILFTFWIVSYMIGNEANLYPYRFINESSIYKYK